MKNSMENMHTDVRVQRVYDLFDITTLISPFFRFRPFVQQVNSREI